MDINCTTSCLYQKEGKCTLSELPSYTQSVSSSVENVDSDCPYCRPVGQTLGGNLL